MKYAKLTLDINYEYYDQYLTDSLNTYKKNVVNYSQGKFFIFVDADKVEQGKENLAKSADKKFKREQLHFRHRNR